MNWKQFVTEVNQNFVIRYKFDEDKKTSLIGAGRYPLILEKAKDADEMTYKHFQKALSSPDTKVVIRLRGGLTISFCRK